MELNLERSTFSGEAPPRGVVIHIKPHPKGEVFTLETRTKDGRVTASSSILYLDGQPHDVADFECAGTQISRRLDERTVEIARSCGGGKASHWVRRISPDANELVLEITEGNRVSRRLVLMKATISGKTESAK